VALGYWGDEERTRRVYKPNPSAPPELRAADMAVYSGDLVKSDEEGYLYFVGRRDDLIKTSGFRVSPQEVEDLLYEIPEVREAAAFGQGDFATGQTIAAAVALHPGAGITADDIREHVRRSAPAHMVPQTIHILPDLPKTTSGKIDRTRVKNEHVAIQQG
jgi:acyl-coenzyme A synthetase/AMP-(fatty) acid ligase